MGYLKNKKIGVIGLGNMGSAILNGLILSGAAGKGRLIGFDCDPVKVALAERKFCLTPTKSIEDLAFRADIILIAVKPRDIGPVLKQVSKAGAGKLVISIAAGIKTKDIERYLERCTRVIRVMPNTPALVGEGISVMCAGKSAGRKDLGTAKEIFSAVGETIELKERYFDIVTAVSGSGPAYFFYLEEALIEAAERLGLKKDIAKRLVLKTALGSAKLLSETAEGPCLLRRRVTSRGGTTEQAIKVFEKERIKEAVLAAVRAAAAHSKILSREAR